MNIVLASSINCALLVRSERGLLDPMKQDRDYWYRTPVGRVVQITRSSRDYSLWEIRLDKRFVCDGFDSPEHAARSINELDFEDEATMDLFRGISVPYEMHMWWDSPPEPPPNARRYYN